MHPQWLLALASVNTIRNIPAHAEWRFAELAAAYGATCNKATEDEKGWDYLLQFQARQRPRIPLDMAEPTKSCFVQIKSSSGTLRGVRLKLSNALEFATNQTPCFVVLFPYDAKAQPRPDIFVLHFWNKEIEKTLKRVRELEAGGRKDLHNFQIRFSRREMKTLSANDVVAEIQQTLECYGEKYAEIKRHVAKTVGFREIGVEATFTFAENVKVSDFVDLSLGIKESLDVVASSFRTIRFGIQAREPEIITEAGRISIQVNPLDAVAVISSEIAGKEVAANGKLYAPAWPELPMEERRLRFVSSMIEVRFRPKEGRATLQSLWDENALYSLAEAEQYINLLEVFAEGDVQLTLVVNGVRVVSGAASLQPFSISPINRLIGRYIKFLTANLKEYNAPKNFRMTLSQLSAAIEDIEAHTNLIDSKEFDASARMLWDGKNRFGKKHGKAFYYVPVEISNSTIYTIVRRNCLFAPSRGGNINFRLKEIEKINVIAIPGTIGETEGRIIQQVEAQAASFADVVVFKNFGLTLDHDKAEAT